MYLFHLLFIFHTLGVLFSYTSGKNRYRVERVEMCDEEDYINFGDLTLQFHSSQFSSALSRIAEEN